MLDAGQDVVSVHVVVDVADHNVFHYFTGYGCEGYQMVVRYQSLGMVPEPRDCWKMKLRTTHSGAAISLRKRAGIRSGPAAFLGLSLSSRASTPFRLMVILGRSR